MKFENLINLKSSAVVFNISMTITRSKDNSHSGLTGYNIVDHRQHVDVVEILVLVLILVLVVDERGSFSAVGAHIFSSFIQTVLEDVD